jgi:ssDNA-binding Zn-finger/Zn-ribbon topoisomerase 1
MFNKDASDDSLGKLKHTTKENCEECGKAKLQLRERIMENAEVQYHYCPKCGFERLAKNFKLVDAYKRQAKVTTKFEEKVTREQDLKRKERYKNRSKK